MPYFAVYMSASNELATWCYETDPIPLVYRMSGSFSSILHMPNFGETSSSECEHLSNM